MTVRNNTAQLPPASLIGCRKQALLSRVQFRSRLTASFPDSQRLFLERFVL